MKIKDQNNQVEQECLSRSANKKIHAFGRMDHGSNLKVYLLPTDSTAGPEVKPTDNIVRYPLPKQPKVPLGVVFLGFAALIAAAVAVYRLFGY